MNNLKTKVDILGAGKLETVPVDLEILSNIADNEVAKETNFNTLKTTVDKLDKNISDATTLIHINQ